MSRDMYVQLLRSKKNPIYQKFLKILKACLEADIKPPEEVDKYFDECGDIEYPLTIDFKARECEDHYGFEIDIKELPEGVETIRVYME